MIASIVRWSTTFIAKRFLVKFILLYSFVICTAFFIVYTIVVSAFVRSIKSEELHLQAEIRQKMKANAEKKIRGVEELVQQLYYVEFNQMTIVDMLSRSNKEATVNALQSFLRSSGYFAGDLLDIIVVKRDDGNAYSATSLQDRSLVPQYDLRQHAMLRDVIASNAKMRVASDRQQEYMLSFHRKPALAFAGALLDINKLPQESTVGYYIVNLSEDSFTGVLQEYSGKIKGHFLLVDRQGNRLLDSFGGTEAEKQTMAADELQALSANNGTYLIEQETVQPLGWTLYHFIPKDEIGYKKIEELQGRMLWIVGISLIASMVIILFVSRVFTFRMNRLMKSMRRAVQKDVLEVVHIDGSSDEIGQLSQTFNVMCERLKDYIDRVYVSEIRRKNAELEALQYKMNPHFLFNTLEALRLKALENRDAEVSDMIAILGNLFRWNVKSKDVIVDIEDELEYITAYLTLQQLRYGDRLTLETQVSGDILAYGIPKLCLQPIVENAINYAVDSRAETGRIVIRGYREGDYARLSVADDGPGMDSAKLNELRSHLYAPEEIGNVYGVGLRNAHQRLRLLFGEACGIRLDSEPGRGTEVTLTVPAKTAEEMKRHVQNRDRG